MDKEKVSYKVVSFLNREELDFLDNLEKDIYFTYGIHIPRTKLIETIIVVFREKEIKDNASIGQELVKKFRQLRETTPEETV